MTQIWYRNSVCKPTSTEPYLDNKQIKMFQRIINIGHTYSLKNSLLNNDAALTNLHSDVVYRAPLVLYLLGELLLTSTMLPSESNKSFS